MSNALTKADAKRQKALKADSLRAALKNGGSMVWLSCLVMGLGNIMAGQTIKGLLFLLVEIGFIVFMVIPGESYNPGNSRNSQKLPANSIFCYVFFFFMV